MKLNSIFAISFAIGAILIAHHGMPIAHDYPELTKEQLELCKHGNFHPACEESQHGNK